MADPQAPKVPAAAAPTSSPASSSPSPSTSPPAVTAETIAFYGTPPILHYSALGASILAPIALLIPSGRKGLPSQLQNMLLGTGAFWGFNQLAYDYTSKSIIARSNARWGKAISALDPQGLPTERAEQVRAQLAAHKLRKQDEAARAEAERLEREDEENRRSGLLSRVWMGDEKEDWKQRRIEDDKKALEEGKGYGDIIMDQIWEVWNQGTGKGKKEAKVVDAVGESPKTETPVEKSS